MLRGFLQQAGSATSFLAIPGYVSYAPRSGQIFGVLKQMQEDFEADLSETQKEELKSKEDYDSLKAAKQDQIESGHKMVAQLDSDIGDFSEKHAQAAQLHADTSAQLELDKAFLADLTAKCSESSSEYETRVKDRLE